MGPYPQLAHLNLPPRAVRTLTLWDLRTQTHAKAIHPPPASRNLHTHREA